MADRWTPSAARSGPAYTSRVSTRHRHALTQARRLVVKVGSSSLTTGEGELDLDRLHRVVDVLAAQRGTGTQVVLVSSGAIAAGIGAAGPAPAAARPGHPAGRGERRAGALLAAYSKAFGGHGLTVGQILLTADDVTRRTHYANARRTLDRLLDLGVVPVVNENDTVATHEIRVGDNDRLAALVAHLVHADALLLLSDVDALYDGAAGAGGHDADPAGARPRATSPPCASAAPAPVSARGGMATKVEAAGIATAAGITTVLTSTAQSGEVLAGARRRHGLRAHRLAARLRGCSGWRTRPRRAAGCCSTRARSTRSSTGASRCCRRASRGRGQLRRR